MASLQNKIDFAVILSVKRANPNGDPLNGNRPRTDYDNFGEMTDVCNKRKIRDRLLEKWVVNGKIENDGNEIFVQSDDRKQDAYTSLKARAEAGLSGKLGSSETIALACKKWFDVRAFGQLFALKAAKKTKKINRQDGEDESDGSDEASVSIGIRGPVTVQSAFSVEPIDVVSTQITKSVNGEDTKDGKKSSDTMGTKHRVEKAIYVFFGSMNPQLAEKTGFSDLDALAIKSVLPKLFENDESSARPGGSMEVLKVVWWNHNCRAGKYSAAKVHRSLSTKPDGQIELANLSGLEPEVIEGF
jgi:CRISPR-associated protein Csd2